MKLAILFLAIAMLADGAACNSSGGHVNGRTKSQELALTVGTWGGQHIHAEITERGADIEFDCAQGSIPQRITLDGSGHFDVGGKFSTQRPGPTRDDESSSRTVQYRGAVKDNEMDLTIFDPKTKEDLGSFKLKLGNEGRLMKCR